jgi:hypothetical protein
VHRLILLYALLSATLYCSLMPLWEGFDELFHYGYVEHVATTGTVPRLGRTMLPKELWASLDYLPVSRGIQNNIGRPTTSMDEYFRLGERERAERRQRADFIDRAWREQPSPRGNYEAQQAPLTYYLLAPLDAALARASLTTRVLVLRLFLAYVTIALLWVAMRRFASKLGLTAAMEAAWLFTVFSCQMLYAATCRIGNDALLAPWLLLVLLAAERPWQLGLLMGAGLLIKSSALAFVPLLFTRRWPVSAGVAAAVAGPWYIRNLVLYHSLSANVESTAGVTPATLLKAVAAVPWGRSIGYTLHRGLWTGNNSFATFSEATLNAVIALALVALVMYARQARRRRIEVMTVAAVALYGVFLAGTALSFFIASGGAVSAPMPWYMPVVLAPVLGLGFLGLGRSATWGRWVAVLTMGLWGYVALVSWVAKLVPLYAGFDQVHTRVGALLNWYVRRGAERDSALLYLCPAPPAVLYTLLVIVVGLTVFLAVRSIVFLTRLRY